MPSAKEKAQIVTAKLEEKLKDIFNKEEYGVPRKGNEWGKSDNTAKYGLHYLWDINYNHPNNLLGILTFRMIVDLHSNNKYMASFHYFDSDCKEHMGLNEDIAIEGYKKQFEIIKKERESFLITSGSINP